MKTISKQKEMSELFNVPYSTITSWHRSQSRVGYVEMLNLAYSRLCFGDLDFDSLSSENLISASQKLGFHNPLSLTLCVKSRTFRNWYNDPEQHKLCLAMLIGYQSALLNELLENIERATTFEQLTEKVASLNITVGELVESLISCRVTTTKLVNSLF